MSRKKRTVWSSRSKTQEIPPHPIEEERGEVKMRLETGSPADTWMDVRLAQLSTDYYVPLRLPEGEKAVVRFSESRPKPALSATSNSPTSGT